MIALDKYDTTQPSMRKAWKAEFHEFLVDYYRPSFINADYVFKAIGNVDNFIKKQNLGDRILLIKDIEVIQKVKRTLLSHRSFALGGTVSANDPKVIVLERYSDFLNIKTKQASDLAFDDDHANEKERKATEGMLKEVKYFRSSRNRAIRNQCAERDNYTCQVCGFNFEKTYGKRGKGFIEVHHKNPMANYDEEHDIKLEDLVALCSNCHSMIHYGGAFLSVEEFRRILRANEISKTH